MLLWPVLAAIVFGLIGFGEVLEDALRIARDGVRSHAVSGDIVLVDVDDASLREVGSWPWARSKQAKIVSEIDRLGAKKIVMDILYANPSSPAEDAALARAISRSGKVILAVQNRVGDQGGKQDTGMPLSMFAKHAKLAAISVSYNWQNSAWRVPYAADVGGRALPSLAASAAGVSGPLGSEFLIDYALDPNSVPRISAADLLSGRVERSQIAGKTVMVGTNSTRIGDQYFIPGRGKRGGVFIHLLAAETLKKGASHDLGWVPALLIALGATVVAVRKRRHSVLAVAAGVIFVLPLATESLRIWIDITPALFLVGTVAARLGWMQSRSKGLVNSLTGLPNLAALAADSSGKDLPLVAVRVHNYAEIASTLDAAGERQFIEQIVARLTLGQENRRIYQGDEGIFAWFAPKGTPFASHLDALHALFRSPVRVGGTSIDAVLSFGVELGSSRSPTSRLGSALVAADDADTESLKWKFHDPARLEDVPWRLSLLSQLDKAIENGEVWLAYQPKLDLATRRTIGAEALARWTHPEKGPISPVEFISAAEQHDRIEPLTDFVLDKAVEAAANIGKRGIEFEIAVNLSARMLTDRRLPARVAAVLDKHGLEPGKLTLELTETAAVSGTGYGIELLAGLRELGVKIAIDDYGTGLSTLEYLKKIPASEIKIDQSFVKSMRDNRSDLIMVQSTIALAHSLGRTVVAEGVEDPQSLEQLTMLKCDIAQGFIVGRPMSYEEIVRRLLVERRRTAA
ncbi:EAL domain-containing protein [Sphingomonas alba]|uniref:EAL domain-containing protein n=1 Tax=Sphingomonas alba TaxID=2908208 RepID=A0ABT0RIA0_9SPHN|nr:EAL domain-containing protein [Sphingomonas alba]MCL6682353.1 EAL domain-containing protein [Sphingomonas alba]